MIKARVFPEPVFAAPRISLPASECGKEALWISVIFVYLESLNPSFVFWDKGSWLNFLEPAYCEYVFSSIFPIGALFGSDGTESGLEPGSGLPKLIQESSKLISSTSESLFCNLNFLDLGAFMVAMSSSFWV